MSEGENIQSESFFAPASRSSDENFYERSCTRERPC